MPGPYLSNAGTFLISTLFGMYILAILLRFILQVIRADFYNPISQFIVKITNPPLKPLRRFIPGIKGIDVSSLVLALLVKMAEVALIAVVVGLSPTPQGTLVSAIAGLMETTLQIFLIAIFVQVILSWIAPSTYNPAVSLLNSITEPLLKPARNLLPPMGGLDLSPLVVLIVLQLASMLLVAPIRDIGFALMQ